LAQGQMLFGSRRIPSTEGLHSDSRDYRKIHTMKVLIRWLVVHATFLAAGNVLHASVADDSLCCLGGHHCSRDMLLPFGESPENDLSKDGGLQLLQVDLGILERGRHATARSSANGSGSKSSRSSSNRALLNTEHVSKPGDELQRYKQDTPTPRLVRLWKAWFAASVDSAAERRSKGKIPISSFTWATSLLTIGTRDVGVSALDFNDKCLLLFCGAIFVLFCCVTTFCLVTFDRGKPQDSFAKGVMQSWCKPLSGVEPEVYPAISAKPLLQRSDFPIVVPLGPMMHQAPEAPEAAEWMIDVLSSRGTVPFGARLTPARRGGPAILEVLHQNGSNQPKASIDDTLTIRDAQGRRFGRLVQRTLNGRATFGTAARPSTSQSGHDSLFPLSTPFTPASSTVTLPVSNGRSFPADSGSQFVLEETSGRPGQWAMAYNPLADDGSFMDVKWLPSNQVLATIEKKNGYLLVANSHGVDAILVLACVLGLVAFKPPMGDAWGQSIREEYTEEYTSTAASLLERLQHR